MLANTNSEAISMDLNKIVNDAMVKIQEEGFVETVVKKQLESTLQKTINDLFGHYGEFSKQIEKEVKESLNINLKSLNLAGYNTMVLNEVKSALDNALHIQGVEKIKEGMDRLLAEAKSEYKLSELIEMFKKEVNDDHDYDGESISFHPDIDRSSLSFIYFDKDSGEEKYRCDYCIVVNNSDNSIHSIKIEGKNLDNKSIMWGFHGFEKTLFQIFASAAKVIVDVDSVDENYEYND